jgi:outer membrane protein assembly factor BamB
MGLLLALALAASPQDRAEIAPPPNRTVVPLWTRDLVAPDLLEWRPEEPGGPAVDPKSGIVVAGARDGVVRAFDADGALAWSFATRAGIGATPLVHDGLAYAGSLDGNLYALDLFTGAERWRYAVGDETGALVAVKGLVVVATHQDTVLALDARSGAWRWTHRRERKGDAFSIRGVAAPVLAHGLLFAAYSDGAVAALDPETGVARWERVVAPKGDQQDVDSLAADGARVYAAAYSGAVVALDPATGRTLWEERVPGPIQVLAADDRVYVAVAGKVLALDARDGALRWSRAVEGEVGGRLARLGPRLAVPTGKGLLLLDPLGGRVMRLFDPGSGVSAPPAVNGRRVYLLSNAGSLVAVRVE